MDLVDHLPARTEAEAADRAVQLLAALAEVVRRQRDRAVAERATHTAPGAERQAILPPLDADAHRPARPGQSPAAPAAPDGPSDNLTPTPDRPVSAVEGDALDEAAAGFADAQARTAVAGAETTAALRDQAIAADPGTPTVDEQTLATDTAAQHRDRALVAGAGVADALAEARAAPTQAAAAFPTTATRTVPTPPPGRPTTPAARPVPTRRR